MGEYATQVLQCLKHQMFKQQDEGATTKPPPAPKQNAKSAPVPASNPSQQKLLSVPNIIA